MNKEGPIHKGILLLPPVGKILKKSWQSKHCLLYKASISGIARLEVYDAADSKEFKIFALDNCVTVHSKNPRVLSIITKTSVYEFGTPDDKAFEAWRTAIQTVAFPDELSKVTTMEEDNELYCSSGEGVFNVKLHPSTVSLRCGLENKHYTLVLTTTALQLRNSKDDKLLFTWPYCFIRKYGYTGGKFTFEAGRKCETGEGTFLLEHTNEQEIFRCLGSKMKSMKKLLNNDQNSSYFLESGDLQLHSALTMEPRSRTPLPAFSASTHSLPESRVFTGAQKNMSFESDKSCRPPKAKQPSKPPRKYNPKGKQSPELSPAYEPIDKYEDIEVRNEAWKTMGVDNPKHTEQLQEPEEALYGSWGGGGKGQDTAAVSGPKLQIYPKVTKILTASQASDLNGSFYDKLDYFGSSSKLNSGYKHVIVSPAVQSMPVPPSFNAYDEVCLETDEIRSADDSHLGYGTIRKDGRRSPIKEDRDSCVSHNFYNDDQYAIISKPKQV